MKVAVRDEEPFQCTLKDLLTLVLIAAIFIGLPVRYGWDGFRQRRAIAALTARGCDVSRIMDAHGSVQGFEVSVRGTGVDDGALAELIPWLAQLRPLMIFTLRDTNVTREGLRAACEIVPPDCTVLRAQLEGELHDRL